MMGASVSPNFWNCSMESHTSKTETAPSTSMAQWNRRPGTLPKPAPACSSCFSTSSFTAGVKPVGRKYKPNAIDILLTKMNRHDCSRDHKRVRVCGVVTFRTPRPAAYRQRRFDEPIISASLRRCAMVRWYAWVILVGLAAGSWGLAAQTATVAGTATLTGTVESSTPYSAAQVFLRNTDKRMLYMVYTNEKRFRAVALFPGNYEISAATKDLKSDVQKLTIKAGESPKEIGRASCKER